MAPPPGTLRVGRYFLALLGLLAVLYALIVFPGERHTPKLGIDLVGGLRVVYTALTPHGAPPPTSAQMSQARQILEDRINTYGVTGATVVVQGSNQLVVEIPGGTGADVSRLGQAAILNFRGVMTPAQPVSCVGTSPIGGVEFQVPASDTVTPAAVKQAFASAKVTIHGSPKLLGTGAKRVVSADVQNTSTASLTSAQQKTVAADVAKSLGIKQSDVRKGPLCARDPFASVIKADPSLKTLLTQSVGDHNSLNAEKCPSPAMPSINGTQAPCHAFADLKATQQQEITSALPSYDCNAAQTEADIAYSYYVACDDGTQSQGAKAAYLMGHVVVPGTHIGSATAVAPNSGGIGGSVEWTVSLNLKGSGADAWHAWTSAFHTDSSNQNTSLLQTSSTAPCGPNASLPCSTWVGFTLDGQVISAPITLAVLDTNTSISGQFTQSSAEQLARELNYGKLPVNFRAEENNKVSATLGQNQLRAAFIAGGIGLALVIIYSLLYYRALGLVTIASLLVSGTLTYAMLVILSKQIGFTLDLAGIAGFIVALGITADSFVVFFERIKDEVHEGRSMRVAVPRAWMRARRTILSADTVSFLAAAILYYFASADVKGFAFTLGMSTILDLVVVFLFTHPMVSLLSRLPAFGSSRFTGLSAVRVGGIATADDEPPPPRKRPARIRRAAASAEPDGRSTVAVLDKPENEEDADAVEEAEPAAPVADEPPRERRKTTPEPGTAAERAAARRARLRDQQADQKGRP